MLRRPLTGDAASWPLGVSTWPTVDRVGQSWTETAFRELRGNTRRTVHLLDRECR